MKSIKELSKDELVSMVLNNMPDVGITVTTFECAVCGKTDKADYYYICDACEKAFEKRISEMKPFIPALIKKWEIEETEIDIDCDNCANGACAIR